MDVPWVLGLGGNHHNGSACLLRGDTVVVAIQEERLNGIKRSPLRFSEPSLAVNYCLRYAGITPGDLDLVVCCPTAWSGEPSADVRRNQQLDVLGKRTPFLYVPHHLGHATAAFALSGFPEAAILVHDGMGSPFCDLTAAERAVVKHGYLNGSESHSFYHASGATITPLEKYLLDNGRWRCYPPVGRHWLQDALLAMPDPIPPCELKVPLGMWPFHTLGTMYERVAEQIFGDPQEGPGKMMGLAPYGSPRYTPDAFFAADGVVFTFSPALPKAFAHDDRYPQREQEYKDLAASAQCAFEEGVERLVQHLRTLTDSERLVYTGGCALNSVANERIVRAGGFKEVFILPAAEDSGVSVGAAYWGLWQLTKRHTPQVLRRDSFGASYSSADIARAVERVPYIEYVETTDPIGTVVDELARGRIIALFEDGSELGPRALGQRSILSDPRRNDGKDVLNQRVKFREGFRPFAPVVLRDHCAEWFETEPGAVDSPFMLRVLPFRAERRCQVPAVVHVDGTGRVQTVTADANGTLFQIVARWHEKVGIPMLLNTSFNVKGEPIVETPEDALWSLLFTGIDLCYIGGRLVRKAASFRSPLDLFPIAAATFDGCPGERRVTLRKAWGVTPIEIARLAALQDVCEMVPLLDGRRTAREVFSSIQPRAQRSLGRPEHLLAVIRRIGLIDLLAAPR